jgi:two-component system, LytTR family, response regulator
MTRALIVDDEPNNIENLKFLLENDCDNVTVVYTAANGKIAREWLVNNDVDVVFLDIQMPVEDGFEMLKKIDTYNFKVVFVTAYNKYAVQAIKAGAVDYLVKPVSILDLQEAVNKLQQIDKAKILTTQNETLINNLVNNFEHNKPPTKIAVPQAGGVSIVEFNDIVGIQADSNYSIIYKKDMQKIIVSKSLKDFEELLPEVNFLRIHKSSIVNINFINNYNNADGGSVRTEDGNVWSVSRRQYETLIQKLKANNIMFFK